jgi:endonuclease/exonuclease/phosphatase family metal-dependent hydrolase
VLPFIALGQVFGEKGEDPQLEFCHLLPWPADPPFAVLPRGEGCVLCGDFNSPAGSPEYAPLSHPGDAPVLANALDLAHPAVPPAPTFGVHDRRYIAEPACYDLFWVSENIAGRVAAVEVDGATDASDHQPVVLELNE